MADNDQGVDDAQNEDVNETATETDEVDEDTTGADDTEDHDEWDPERYKAAMSKKNRENESLRKRLKALEARDQELKKIEDSRKSDTERLTESKTAAEKEASTLRLENNQLRLQIELGLTEEQAKRVRGDDYDEMKADAEELLTLFKASEEGRKKPASTTKTKPAPGELKGGLKPSTGDDGDVTSVVERIYKNSHIF
jgi:hypothetical protein